MSRLMSGSSGVTTSGDTSGLESIHTEKSPSSLGAMVQFGFHAKTSYDADEALLQTRSESFKTRPVEKDRDIWKRPPPDFRYVVYDPRPPRRNTVDAMQPWRYGTLPGHSKTAPVRREENSLPRIFDKPEREPEIVTRFHIDRPFTAKKKFVTEGMNYPGPYDNPTPHDFRQYPSLKKLGLDEFMTKYEKDPFNIHFKSKRLNHIHGLCFEPVERDLVPGRQMGPPMSAKEQWEAALVLEKTKWPQKPEAYTRFRRRHRQPYSAFMERVEGDLSGKWYKERLDDAIGGK